MRPGAASPPSAAPASVASTAPPPRHRGARGWVGWSCRPAWAKCSREWSMMPLTCHRAPAAIARRAILGVVAGSACTSCTPLPDAARGAAAEAPARTATSAITLLEPPLLVLGEHLVDAETLDGRHPYLQLTELRSGMLVVNDRVSLKFFAPNGALRRVAGRGGSGPGEFSQTRDTCRSDGDTIVVIDAADGRVSMWSDTGDHLRTLRRPGYVPPRDRTERGTLRIP